MPTKKIADAPDYRYCKSTDHEPPSMQVFEPGTYQHECPACHRKVVFTVTATQCSRRVG